MSNHGPYVILDEMIDHSVWANDYRFQTLEEAQRKAKKLAFKQRKDYYVAQLVTGIELRPDVEISTTQLLENKDASI